MYTNSHTASKKNVDEITLTKPSSDMETPNFSRKA